MKAYQIIMSFSVALRKAIRHRQYGLAVCSLDSVFAHTYKPRPYAAYMVHALQQVGYQPTLYAPGLSESEQVAAHTACCRSRLEFRHMCTDPSHIIHIGTSSIGTSSIGTSSIGTSSIGISSILFTTSPTDAKAFMHTEPKVVVVGIANGNEPHDFMINGADYVVQDIPHAIELIWKLDEPVCETDYVK